MYAVKCRIGFCSSNELRVVIVDGHTSRVSIGSTIDLHDATSAHSFRFGTLLYRILRRGWLFAVSEDTPPNVPQM
jgi:hypothetical protein